jgi:hypothetical protein
MVRKRQTATTIKQRYGDDYYKIIGTRGGLTPKTKPHGFAAMPLEKRRAAGRKGGTISRRYAG